MQCKLNAYTTSYVTKQDTQLVSITSGNIDWLSQFCHSWTRHKVCYKITYCANLGRHKKHTADNFN